MEPHYISDAADVPADALMDEPFCTVTLDLSLLSVQQQLQVVQQLGPDKLAHDDMRAAYGAVAAGADEEPYTDLEAVLHVDAGRAMTFLQQVGILGPDQVADVEDEDDTDPEEELAEINDDD